MSSPSPSGFSISIKIEGPNTGSVTVHASAGPSPSNSASSSRSTSAASPAPRGNGVKQEALPANHPSGVVKPKKKKKLSPTQKAALLKSLFRTSGKWGGAEAPTVHPGLQGPLAKLDSTLGTLQGANLTVECAQSAYKSCLAIFQDASCAWANSQGFAESHQETVSKANAALDAAQQALDAAILAATNARQAYQHARTEFNETRRALAAKIKAEDEEDADSASTEH